MKNIPVWKIWSFQTMNDFPNEAKLFEDTRKNISLKDARSKSVYHAENKNEKKVLALRVDGVLIKDGNKCDYALIVQENTAYLIELKGKDREWASRQLETSLDYFCKCTNLDSYHGRISLSRVQKDLHGTQFKKAEKAFRKRNGTLKYQETPFNDTI